MAPALARADGIPQRIVSLNMCSDQIVVDLVPRERIRAVSHLAADPLVSAVARRQGAFRGRAATPRRCWPSSLISSSPASTRRRRRCALLERLGLKILKVPVASDFDGARAVTRLIADAVGERDKAERLLADFDRRMAALRRARVQRPKAVVYQVNNLASGPGSVADNVLRAAGFANLTAELNLGPGGQLPLEAARCQPARPDRAVGAHR